VNAAKAAGLASGTRILTEASWNAPTSRAASSGSARTVFGRGCPPAEGARCWMHGAPKAGSAWLS